MKNVSTAVLALLSLMLAPSPFQSAWAGELPEATQRALIRALEDERHAEAFYSAVIAKFGEVRPFANIINAERRHASEVIAVMKQYGVEGHSDALAGSPPTAPATLHEACKMGVDAEIANKSLYDEQLIPAAKGHSDIIALFERLRDASQNRHLPAFTRCAE